MTEQRGGPRAGDRQRGDSAAGASDDAVLQAKLWLAERGVPDPGSVDPSAVDGGRVSGVSRPDTSAARSLPFSGADPTDPDADPIAVARTIVLRKLAAKARTRAELSRALQAKQVPQEAADAVLDRMEAVGLIDDGGFARDWVESRQQRRHLSRSALRRELSTKGVDRVEIDSALEQVDVDDELVAAQALVAKKLRLMSGLDRQVRYRRLAAILGRRGFGPGVVSRVVGAALDPQDD